MTAAAQDLLQISDLSLHYRGEDGPAQVLKGIDMTVRRGEIAGLVGESGCGKSTLMKTVLAALPANAVITSGSISFEGRDLLQSGEFKTAAAARSRFGFVPQDPYLSLNPLFTVGDQLLEIMRWNSKDEDGWRGYNRARRKRHRATLLDLMKIVGFADPMASFDRYPHQFSGGQRQRILIVGALSCSSPLIIADEPTTALDVTTQKGILGLLRDIVDEFGVSILLVTHDLGVVAQVCDSVNIIEYGRIVETGPTGSVLFDPSHAYTQRLLSFHPDRIGRLREDRT